MRRKGDEKSRERLLKIEVETVTNLEKARDAAAAGKHNAENWLRAQQTVLDNVRKALAIDYDQSIADGAITAVNPEGPNIGEPL
jgi:hypothetical protein